MKRLLVATAIFLAASSAGAANTDTDTDDDIACAASALAVAPQVQRNSREWYSLLMTYSFFVGRLTGRNEQIDWQKVVFDRMATEENNPNLWELQVTCQQLVTVLTPIGGLPLGSKSME